MSNGFASFSKRSMTVSVSEKGTFGFVAAALKDHQGSLELV
jgi:hypothetical protein